MGIDRVEAAFREAVRPYPLLDRELSQLLPALSGEEARCLKVLYAGLDVQDLLGGSAASLLENVRASILARRELSYAADVPEELFETYILPPRVNNETPDGSRSWLYSQLRDRVQGKDMLAAALEVNYWCCEHATYFPTDDRTISPFGMCNRTRGRCGEESTLAVSALRAVCIPARQVYAPRWAHCDDNHAWVEFWADGQWHYMGACEPEPVPDTGWFTAAASRAMLVRAIAPEPGAERGCTVVNTTARYAETACLTVRVEAEGRPQPGVMVRFQLVNDSRLHTIYEAETGVDGLASFETGLGCLVVSARLMGRLAERLVDVRTEREATLSWEEGFDPLTEERAFAWELVPPRERVPAPPAGEDEAHRLRLAQCEAARRGYEAAFRRESHYLELAAGNWEEIKRFLALPQFTKEDKEALLSTLTEKDFADVSCETLEDALAAALPWKGRYQELVWVNWVLAPRVEWEPLLPVRCELMSRLSDENLQTGEDVLAWMGRHIKMLEDLGPRDRRGNAAAYLRHGVCPKSEWDILAVQFCRSVGIPAFLSPDSGRIMLVTGEGAYIPGEVGKAARLRLTTTAGPLTYREHFTLARWIGEDYHALAMEHTVQGRWDLFLPAGSYRLITARRQIDGTVSARVESFLLTQDRVAQLTLAPDRTAEMLLSAALPPVMVSSLTGEETEELTAPTAAGSLMIYAQPGAEPTEHLFQELLELAAAYREGGWPIAILLARPEEAENDTLRRVLERLPTARCRLFAGDAYSVRRALGVGDARLPLAVALDRQGRGVYACANYNIRTAHTLLRVLRGIQ